jgi:hypothetical protein
MRARNRNQKGCNIQHGRVDHVAEWTTLASRAEIAFIARDSRNNSGKKNGMVLMRVEFILTAKTIGGGQGT